MMNHVYNIKCRYYLQIRMGIKNIML
uniref:Uncharacterized protein n=1 Tax=Heterorhabditis bacteriophora TaxID=37862 RepID=A0A1I7WIA2_HETBA